MLSKKSYLPLISYLLVVCYIPGFLFFSVPFSEYKGYSFVEPPAVVIVVAVLALLIINFIWRIKKQGEDKIEKGKGEKSKLQYFLLAAVFTNLIFHYPSLLHSLHVSWIINVISTPFLFIGFGWYFNWFKHIDEKETTATCIGIFIGYLLMPIFMPVLITNPLGTAEALIQILLLGRVIMKK